MRRNGCCNLNTQTALETSNGFSLLLQTAEDDDKDNEEVCNLKRIEYSSWAQAALSAVLLENFYKSDAPIFKSHGILKSDAGDFAKHPDCEGEHNALDNRIPYATNMYLALQAQFDTKSSIDSMAKIMDYDRVRSGFTGRGDITSRTKDLWLRYCELLAMSDKYDSEFVSLMELLLVMKK